MTTEYRKPNGKITKSGRAYCLAWRREINLPLEKHYGVTVIAFDPGLTVVPKGGGNPVSLPLWLSE